MNTQPVPTFPVVAGLEKYYGMTIQEISAVMPEQDKSYSIVDYIKAESLDCRGEDLVKLNMDMYDISLSDELISFLVSLDKNILRNQDVEKSIRATAHTIWFKAFSKI